MARHRDVRNLDYEDYDDDDDWYYEQSPALAPMTPTSSAFMYNRGDNSHMANAFVPPSPCTLGGTESDIPSVPEGKAQEFIQGLSEFSLDAEAAPPEPPCSLPPPVMVRRSSNDRRATEAALKAERVAWAERSAQPAAAAEAEAEAEADSAGVAESAVFAEGHARPRPSPVQIKNDKKGKHGIQEQLGSLRVEAAKAAAPIDNKRKKLIDGENNGKPHLNMVVMGHVDVGKSTLMGHLLYQLGQVSQRTMHKFQKESKELGKASFAFAWVLDQHAEERSRGITVDVGTHHFETDDRSITLLDAPGHRDFIPNMISGVAQADVGVLVVSGTRGEFESGFKDDGQTKEHAVLARALGVSQLVLAVNKMDNVDWSQERFDEVVGAVMPFLKTAGFPEKSVWPIPISGLSGVNITDPPKDHPLLKWHTGGSLLSMINKFDVPKRKLYRPMRFSISDVFKSLSLGTTVAGKLEQGAIVPGDRVLLMPLGEEMTVKSIECRGEPLEIARAGDNVELGIKNCVDPNMLTVGGVLCDPRSPVPVLKRFRARLITMNYKLPIVRGTQMVLYAGNHSQSAHVSRIFSLLHPQSGAVLARKPRALPRQSSAEVEVIVKRSVCLDLFRTCREFGRFSLRRGAETVAVGIVTKLYHD